MKSNAPKGLENVPKYACKVDANHGEIVSALRKMGCFVHSTAAAGNGFPDIAVAFRGRWHLIEIKDGNKPPSARKLTRHQEQFQAEVNGRAPTPVATCVDEAIAIVTEVK